MTNLPTWMPGAFAVILLAAALSTAASQSGEAASDPAVGKAVFQSNCSICHSAQPGQNRTGPTLFGIVGREAHSIEGYNYSPANQNARLTWDLATLDKYLEAPRAVIPGTKMTFAGLKDADKRASVIAFLATLK